MENKKHRKALLNHRKELTELKKQIKEVSKSEINTKESKEKKGNEIQGNQISELRKELKSMNERYINLLEKLLVQKSAKIYRTSDKKSVVSDRKPNSKNTKKNGTRFGLAAYQLLFLLKKSKAKSKNLAVTTAQLKQSFNLNKTKRTIRRRLNQLSEQQLVNTIGIKPKQFFLSKKGLNLISREKIKTFQIK